MTLRRRRLFDQTWSQLERGKKNFLTNVANTQTCRTREKLTAAKHTQCQSNGFFWAATVQRMQIEGGRSEVECFKGLPKEENNLGFSADMGN